MDYFEAYANWYRTELYKVFDDRYVECAISCIFASFCNFKRDPFIKLFLIV